MSSGAFNFFYRADVNLVSIGGNSALSSLTVSLVNKPLKDSSAVGTFWPILQNVGEVSLQAGEFLPNVVFSSITLNNTIGSFGANRKFSDLLQRYSPNEQDVVISLGVSANDVDTVTTWQEVARVQVANWEHAITGGRLTLNVSPFRFNDKVLTLEVARTIAGMENAPEASLGRPVPLVLGDAAWIAPIRITADGGTTARYAFCTGLTNHLQPEALVINSPDFAALTKNDDDQWEAVQLGSNMGHLPIEVTITGSYTLNTHAGRAFQILVPGNEVYSGIQLRAQANGFGGRVSTARLTVEILKVDQTTRAVVGTVATGRVELRNYDALNNDLANTDFLINVSFDDFFFASETSRYWYFIAYAVTGYAANELSLTNTSFFTCEELQKNTGDANNSFVEWRIATSAASHSLRYRLRKVYVSSIDQQMGATQTGLSYGRITLTQDAPDAGQQNPPLDALQFLVLFKGLAPYAGGAAHREVHTVIDRLGYNWTGTAWTDSNTWDTSTLSAVQGPLYQFTGPSTERSRYLRAVYDQRATFSQVVADVCRGTASRVGVLPSGKLFMHPWGLPQAEVADIPAADITPLSWQGRGIGTVVNRAVIASGRSPRYSSNPGNEQIPDGYERSTDFSAQSSPYLTQITAESRTLYGQRDLANGTLNAHGVAANGTSRDSVVAEYHLTRFAKPAVYATFLVPWLRWKHVRLFDVVRFQHPEFPSYYGADPEPPQPVVDSGGGNVVRVDPNQGYEWVRAEPYRGLVEGVALMMAMEHAPMMRLTVLVLLNRPWDPT